MFDKRVTEAPAECYKQKENFFWARGREYYEAFVASLTFTFGSQSGFQQPLTAETERRWALFALRLCASAVCICSIMIRT